MKEKRYINEIRSEGEGENSRHVVGYALLFNVRSRQLGDFVETIDPHALDGVIEKSDVVCLLDHDPHRGVLARSKYGQGTLTLTVDERGLRYEFDAPKTSLGDELLEGVRRGDISNSSFSFTTAEDHWEQLQDGTYHRTILRIEQLFDVSPVIFPAYDETSVTADMRGLEALKKEIERRMNEEKTNEDEVKDEEVKDTPAEDPKTEEKEPAGEPAQTEEDEERNEDQQEEKETKSEDPKDDECRTEEEEETKPEENRNNIAMKKKFSLLKAIRSVVNGEQFDATAASVIAEGRSIMSAANQAVNGQIVLPIENRADGDVTPANGIMATVAGAGMENVAEDKLDIVEPLRNRSALGVAGATFLTGLVGDVSIPVYSGSNCAWKGEVAKADNGEGEFTEVNLKPKRLTAFLDISKQFIYQDSNSAEEMLRRDLVNALSEKLEMTIFGDEAGTANKPAGLFNGVTADTAAVKFADIVDWEAELEDANINGEIKYIVNPSAKAILRKTQKDAGSGLFVMSDGEIEGKEVISTASVVKKGVILGDFRDLVVAQWGALDVVVDPYTKAAEGQIRVVINAYFDAALRRDKAVVKHILK